MPDIESLQTELRAFWRADPSEKARRYVGKFFETTRTGSKIAGKVQGNHGTYLVSIDASPGHLSSACSCYIGKEGFCHHCEALAHTFLETPAVFRVVQPTGREAIHSLDDLHAYLLEPSVAAQSAETAPPMPVPTDQALLRARASDLAGSFYSGVADLSEEHDRYLVEAFA